MNESAVLELTCILYPTRQRQCLQSWSALVDEDEVS